MRLGEIRSSSGSHWLSLSLSLSLSCPHTHTHIHIHTHTQPELYRRVRDEVDSKLEDRKLTYEIMMEMPLLRACLAETLRMYPQPPLLIRRALDDDVLPQGGAAGKTFIAKGTDIFISTWNLHRSPDLWEHPERLVLFL